MKIHKPEPPFVIRINIKRHPDKTEFITLDECTQDEVYLFVKGLIEKQNISPFVKGKVTNVEMREARGGLNGKSVSLSFKGLSPKEVYDIIMNELTNNK